jgi:hypothetical protein
MRFRKIALALFACMALGAFVANAAQAAGWEIGTTENQTGGGTVIASGTHQEVSCAKHSGSSLTFTSTLLGAEVELAATGITCVGAKIDNTTETGHSEGTLKFTGVTVVKPAHCSVPGGSLATNALTDHVIMDPTSGSTVVFDKFTPETGTTFVTVSFEGTECVLAGDSAPVKGTACGEAVRTEPAGTFVPNVTSTLFKVQTLLFGSAQQTTGGCALTLGSAAAQLTGAVDNELIGTNVGKPFGDS